MAKNKRKSRKKLFIIIGVVVILAVIIVANVTRKTSDAMKVQVAKVERGTIVQTVSASGKIRPVVDVKISAKVPGNITNLYVQEGDSVYTGGLLLTLDRERYLAAVERAQSALKSARASLWKAEADFSRVKEMFSKKLTSEADLQAAEANFMLAQSQVEQAQAALKETQDDLSKTEIYSPMKGIISQLNKERGEMTLGASFQEDVIMVIADLSRMKVEVEVDENDVVDVSVGDPVKIEIDAFPDTSFRGKVTRIANSAITRGFGTQEEITNFTVEVAVLDKIEGVRPGMSATADIEVDKHDETLYLPIQCVAMRYPKKDKEEEAKESGDKGKKKKKKKKEEQKEESKAEKPETDTNGKSSKTKSERDKEKMIEVVFVVDETDTARMVPVKTGISSDTEIEILEGLDEGREVVSGPYKVLATRLKDGKLVKKEELKEDESGEENE